MEALAKLVNDEVKVDCTGVSWKVLHGVCSVSGTNAAFVGQEICGECSRSEVQDGWRWDKGGIRWVMEV